MSPGCSLIPIACSTSRRRRRRPHRRRRSPPVRPIGIAFLVAMQCLPAKQRAALILSDVLDWSAKEIAALLELSVASVNSALQRARATLEKQKPDLRPESKPDLDPDEQQRVLLERYVAATERGDAPALAALLREDVRFSMPPEPATYVGRDAVVDAWVQGGFGAAWFGDFRCRVTRANGVPGGRVLCPEARNVKVPCHGTRRVADRRRRDQRDHDLPPRIDRAGVRPAARAVMLSSPANP